MVAAPKGGLLARLGALAGAILDMDGVLYRGREPIPGAREALESLRARLRVRFLTNNSTKQARPLSEQLSRLGFPVAPEDITTIADVATAWLSKRHPGKRLLVLGEDHFAAQLTQAGFQVVAPGNWRRAEIVVSACRLGMDHLLLGSALNALRHGALFVVTNPDLVVDGEGGQQLEAGAYAGMLARASGRAADVVLGKPEAPAYEAALSGLGIPAERTVMIGDNPDTDVIGGRRQGMLALQVLSGVSPEPSAHADLCLPDLASCARMIAAHHATASL
jgi:4-nitrophenyl phosphatase